MEESTVFAFDAVLSLVSHMTGIQQSPRCAAVASRWRLFVKSRIGLSKLIDELHETVSTFLPTTLVTDTGVSNSAIRASRS
jgi:hypothetical protein